MINQTQWLHRIEVVWKETALDTSRNTMCIEKPVTMMNSSVSNEWTKFTCSITATFTVNGESVTRCHFLFPLWSLLQQQFIRTEEPLCPVSSMPLLFPHPKNTLWLDNSVFLSDSKHKHTDLKDDMLTDGGEVLNTRTATTTVWISPAKTVQVSLA